MKLPDCPPEATGSQPAPPPELELLLEDVVELDELELLEEELELLELDDELLELELPEDEELLDELLLEELDDELERLQSAPVPLLFNCR